MQTTSVPPHDTETVIPVASCLVCVAWTVTIANIDDGCRAVVQTIVFCITIVLGDIIVLCISLYLDKQRIHRPKIIELQLV